MQEHLEAFTTFEAFFAEARLNPNASSITGVVFGVRVDNVEDPLMQEVRYLDKQVDELVKGRPIDSARLNDPPRRDPPSRRWGTQRPQRSIDVWGYQPA